MNKKNNIPWWNDNFIKGFDLSFKQSKEALLASTMKAAGVGFPIIIAIKSFWLISLIIAVVFGSITYSVYQITQRTPASQYRAETLIDKKDKSTLVVSDSVIMTGVPINKKLTKKAIFDSSKTSEPNSSVDGNLTISEFVIYPETSSLIRKEKGVLNSHAFEEKIITEETVKANSAFIPNRETIIKSTPGLAESENFQLENKKLDFVESILHVEPILKNNLKGTPEITPISKTLNIDYSKDSSYKSLDSMPNDFYNSEASALQSNVSFTSPKRSNTTLMLGIEYNLQSDEFSSRTFLTDMESDAIESSKKLQLNWPAINISKKLYKNFYVSLGGGITKTLGSLDNQLTVPYDRNNDNIIDRELIANRSSITSENTFEINDLALVYTRYPQDEWSESEKLVLFFNESFEYNGFQIPISLDYYQSNNRIQWYIKAGVNITLLTVIHELSQFDLITLNEDVFIRDFNIVNSEVSENKIQYITPFTVVGINHRITNAWSIRTGIQSNFDWFSKKLIEDSKVRLSLSFGINYRLH